MRTENVLLCTLSRLISVISNKRFSGNVYGSNMCVKCARNLHFYYSFTKVNAPRQFLHSSGPLAEIVLVFMRCYWWLVRK